jgi:hypothetical protein
MKPSPVSISVLVLLLGFGTAVVSTAPDFTGAWIGQTDVPDVGPDQITLVIKKAESGYTATISDAAAIIGPETPVRDVKIEGETITFWFPLANGETVSIQLKIEGDTLTGGWVHESGTSGSMVFQRKK